MPDVCVISGTIVNVDGAPYDEAQVTVQMRTEDDEAQGQGGQVLQGVGVTDQIVSTTTAADGTFSLSVLQGATVEIQIPDINLRKTVVVPLADAVDFTELV